MWSRASATSWSSAWVVQERRPLAAQFLGVPGFAHLLVELVLQFEQPVDVRLERRHDPFVEPDGGVGAAGDDDVAPLVGPLRIVGERLLQRHLQVSRPMRRQVPGGVGGEPGQPLDRVGLEVLHVPAQHLGAQARRRRPGEGGADVERVHVSACRDRDQPGRVALLHEGAGGRRGGARSRRAPRPGGRRPADPSAAPTTANRGRSRRGRWSALERPGVATGPRASASHRGRPSWHPSTVADPRLTLTTDDRYARSHAVRDHEGGGSCGVHRALWRSWGDGGCRRRPATVRLGSIRQ